MLTTTAGYDGYPVEAFEHRGIVLSNCPGISPGTVAEHAIGMARVKRTPQEYDGVADTVSAPDALLDAITDARLVVLAVPLTEATEGLIGADELAAMHDDGILVNVARGPVLDTEALLRALEADALRGAGIDVFDEEPLPAGSPLWDREDVLITPHCAGTTEKYGQRALEIVVDEYRRWAADEEPKHRVV